MDERQRVLCARMRERDEEEKKKDQEEKKKDKEEKKKYNF
jgi:hypothetical protein